MGVEIELVSELRADVLTPLIEESDQEGWHFIRRLTDEWAHGANRFDRPGEGLFLARVDGQVVGVCGLNVDPYTADGSVGRVRRLYVLREHRRRGVGQQLVQAVVAAAAGRFRRLRVRTANPSAGRLYEGLGFRPVTEEPDCTHTLDLAYAVRPR
jgi:GNAT superfamily N-acetyltransferase